MLQFIDFLDKIGLINLSPLKISILTLGIILFMWAKAAINEWSKDKEEERRKEAIEWMIDYRDNSP